MSIIGIVVSFVAALLGLAFPLMLHVIARVEDKYSASIIVDQLQSEYSWRSYRFFLFTTLKVLLLYVIANYLLISINHEVKIIIIHVVSILLIALTVATIVSFILFVDKLLMFDSSTRLTHYLIKKDRGSTDEEYPYFNSLIVILVGSIRTMNIPVAKTISDYCYEVFQEHRDSIKDESIEYPYPLYNLIYMATEELALLKERGMPFLEVRTVGGIWLLGEGKGYAIHETTYLWLWQILNLTTRYERDDFLMHYWERADQHITYNLSPRLIDDYTEDIKKQRKRFLEFQFALGGLLLYRERYSIIGRFFRFTRSQPPQRDLLPIHMNEIFSLYFEFRDPYDREYFRIQSRYSFPEVEGVNSDYVIKNWICKYLALLLIRQYSIIPHLITIKPLENPKLPDTQQKRKMWIDNLGHFKNLVEATYKNESLLTACNLDFVNDKWCSAEEKPTPIEFVENLITKVKEEYERAKVEQPISEQKRLEFLDYTGRVLDETMSLYAAIQNPNSIEDDYKDWFINGGNVILDKSAFAEEQEAAHMNYYSFLANSIADKFQSGVSELFFSSATKRYLIKPENIAHALDKLKLNKEAHILVIFGMNEEYFGHLNPNYSNETGITKELPTLIFAKCNYALVKETIFVISKNDLPTINHLDIEKEEIEKYSLESVNDERRIFASLIDLFRNENIRNELAESRPDENLEESVFLQISTITRIRWKKQIKMVALRLHSRFAERGMPIEISDIEAF